MVGRSLTPNDLLPFMRYLAKDASRRASNARNLGLCVSGGPDSMALAYLFRGLQESHDLKLLGFIVDHKARPESTDEAKQVLENLAKIGVNAKVLTMNWPAGVEPSKLSAFESHARKKRYQLLSDAALQYKMSHLLLGHHRDDQVETALMRLIRDSTLSLKGLAGMRMTSSVPDCGVPDRLGIRTDRNPILLPAYGRFPPLPQSPKLQDLKINVARLVKVARPGGLLLQRPLLDYAKSDLVATCEANKVPYVIDPTNKDPRSNLRNAVRHLRTHHQLPKALGEQRLLKLQQNAGRYTSQVIAKGNAVLSTCQFLDLDLRVGSVKVELPILHGSTALDYDGYDYAISRLTEILTPMIRTEVSYSVPQHVISHLNNIGAEENLETPIEFLHPAFAINRVQFRSKRHRIWTLSRQTMRHKEITDNTNGFSANLQLQTNGKYCSEYLLWDNRFWFRVWAQNVENLSHFQIRPMRDSDLAQLRPKRGRVTQDKQSQRTGLLRLILQLAPHESTNVIPVLTYKRRAVALPTFRYMFKDMIEELELGELQWDVRYNAFSLIDQFPEFRTWAAVQERSDTTTDGSFRNA